MCAFVWCTCEANSGFWDSDCIMLRMYGADSMFCISCGFSEICCIKLCIPGLLNIPATHTTMFKGALVVQRASKRVQVSTLHHSPLPKLPALMPRGLDTLGLVPAGLGVLAAVELLLLLPPPLPVGAPPPSEELEALGGPHGLGSGSRFSVRDGWAPDSEFPLRAENGLLPNCGRRRKRNDVS